MCRFLSSLLLLLVIAQNTPAKDYLLPWRQAMSDRIKRLEQQDRRESQPAPQPAPQPILLAPNPQVIPIAPNPQQIPVAPNPQPIPVAPNPQPIPVAPNPQAAPIAPNPQKIQGSVEYQRYSWQTTLWIPKSF